MGGMFSSGVGRGSSGLDGKGWEGGYGGWMATEGGGVIFVYIFCIVFLYL